MQSLEELALQVLVKGPAVSLRRLSRELRVRINSERFPKKEEPLETLCRQIVPHYCRIYRNHNPELILPTRVTASSSETHCVDCDVLPVTVRRRYTWEMGGLVYEPKTIRKNQTKLTLCHIHYFVDQRPPEDFGCRVWIDTFISQQRLRQLQSLLLPLVRSPASLTSPQLEKDLPKYIDLLDRPRPEEASRKRNYWKDHDWGGSLFERIIDQKLDPKSLPRSFRRAISRVRFEQVRSRPDKVEDRIFHWNTPRSKERRLNDAHRSTLLVYQTKDPNRFQEGFRYNWWQIANPHSTLDLHDVLMSSPASMLIETSPSLRSLRRLQTLLLPLVRPYVRPKDLPFDLDRTDPEPDPERRTISTKRWKGMDDRLSYDYPHRPDFYD